MSPRSEELMAEARECLAAARDMVATNHPGRAASSAYYAMLYAARAALSEKDLYARTHSGIWNLFREVYVTDGDFDEALFKAGSGAQELREAADYHARPPDSRQASEIVEAAERFVATVSEMLGAGEG